MDIRPKFISYDPDLREISAEMPTGMTTEEKNEIRSWLSKKTGAVKDKATADRANAFIEELNTFLLGAADLVHDWSPSRKDVTERKEDVLQSLEQTIENAEKFFEAVLPYKGWQNKTWISGIEFDPAPIIESMRGAPEWAPLYEIRDRLRKQLIKKRKKHRPREIITIIKGDLAQAIAEAFAKHIGPPSSSKDGAFYNVVSLSFKYLDLTFKAPLRHVENALKTLKSNRPLPEWLTCKPPNCYYGHPDLKWQFIAHP